MVRRLLGERGGNLILRIVESMDRMMDEGWRNEMKSCYGVEFCTATGAMTISILIKYDMLVMFVNHPCTNAYPVSDERKNENKTPGESWGIIWGFRLKSTTLRFRVRTQLVDLLIITHPLISRRRRQLTTPRV